MCQSVLSDTPTLDELDTTHFQKIAKVSEENEKLHKSIEDSSDQIDIKHFGIFLLVLIVVFLMVAGCLKICSCALQDSRNLISNELGPTTGYARMKLII